MLFDNYSSPEPMYFKRIKRVKLKVDAAKLYFKSKYYNWQKPSSVTIKGVHLSIPKNPTEDLKQALYCGYYESNELRIISSHLKPEDRVMELGTGLGFLSAFCARKIGNDRVFTYEANPGLKPIIQENYALNKVCPQLKICMLGSEPGEKTFYVSDALWDSSTIEFTENLKPIQVPVKSFNQEIERLNPSFLIVDIEGAEYELCQSTDFHNVKKLSMELHESLIGAEKAEFVKSKLRENGFRENNKYSSRSYQQEELFWERN